MVIYPLDSAIQRLNNRGQCVFVVLTFRNFSDFLTLYIMSLFGTLTDIFLVLSLAMAGNIIPAIATTNAIISGVIVMQALNILSGKLDKCKTVSVEIKLAHSKHC